MLVLSRRKNEKIVIGDGIEVVIVDIRRGQVRIGITAPSEIAVHRLEVAEAIERDGERGREREIAKRRESSKQDELNL